MTRQQRLYDALSNKLSPTVIDIQDETSQHSVPVGSESHFKIVVVSAFFESLNRISRHRLVNQLIQIEFTTGLHALSLHLFTPEEWEQRGKQVSQSPTCKGGSQTIK